MSDPYAHRVQINTYDHPPVLKNNIPVVTPLNPRRGWREASTAVRLLATLALLVPAVSVLVVAVPALHPLSLPIVMVLVPTGAVFYYALHRVLRPLREHYWSGSAVERTIRHSIYALWLSFITPALSLYVYLTMDGPFNEDAFGYGFAVMLITYVVGLLGLAVLLIWTIIAVIVRTLQK